MRFDVLFFFKTIIRGELKKINKKYFKRQKKSKSTSQVTKTIENQNCVLQANLGLNLGLGSDFSLYD